MSLKKRVLPIVLGFGLLGWDFHDRAQAREDCLPSLLTERSRSTFVVNKVHSPAVKKFGTNQQIEFQIDITFTHAAHEECRVEVVLCNALGLPYIDPRGMPLKMSCLITPNTDEYLSDNLRFALSLDDFRLLYGRGARDLTFKVSVRKVKSGKVLNSPVVLGVRGLTNLLPVAPTERTDNPLPQPRSVWMRLILS